MARDAQQRVLVLAPTGRDASLIGDMLAKDAIACLACSSVDEFAREIQAGAGAGVIAEEALIGQSLQPIMEVLEHQPPWSDLPVLFLTVTGTEASATSMRLLSLLGSKANVTILERPVRVATLLSSVRSALRARSRQHEVRDYLEERTRGQEKLLQTQKLESLGVLAGGVAHDFNNLLVGILGNTSLALDTIGPSNPMWSLLTDVLAASETAANLTRQLLAYAGKGRFVIDLVDLSELVTQIGTLIQASIPKHVQLRLQLAERLPCVEADASQLQQLVMNLVINAAEAIGQDRSGTVLVTTGTFEVDENYIRATVTDSQLEPGTYVTMEVQDDGVGMSEETVSKIFDPFFTTKFTGRGLGLAAVHGIVRSHKGALKVQSTPGAGTTFKVLFPVSKEEPVKPKAIITPERKTANETILVIDDEPMVRRTAKAMLERVGYSVVVAENGREGVDLFQVLADKVDVVLLDMTMPVMSGEEAFRELRGMRPELPVILSSGYNEVEAIQRFAGKGLAGFIQKPYSSAALVSKVQAILREGRTQSRPAQS